MRSHNRLLNAVTAPLQRGARAAARRLSSEAGFAVPTVTLMILAALGMAGVAVSTSIEGGSGTVRDRGTKSALAVAESGVDQVLLQYNRHGLVSESNPCEPVSESGPEEGWCGPVTGTDVNDGEVTYHVRPESSELPNGEVAWTELEVVSVGTFAEVTRRVHVSASSSAGQDMFAEYAVKSLQDIAVADNATIKAGSATNGTVTLGAGARQCGPVSVGIGEPPPGEGFYADENCETSGGTVDEDEIALPPVNQGDAATNNDNFRITNAVEDSGEPRDAISGSASDLSWNAETRELSITSNTSLTLGGSVYSFCKVTLLENSAIYVSSPSTTIYFDSPEACGYETGAQQLEILSNARLTSADGVSADLALLFVGASTVRLNSNTDVGGSCQQNFIIYGPETDVDLEPNSKFCGAMGVRSVDVGESAQLFNSSGTGSFVLPNTAPHYVTDRFVDCTATDVTGVPDEGC